MKLSKKQNRLRLESLEKRELLTDFDVLVFSRTVEFRHNSIEAGIELIETLGQQNNFSVTATEAPNDFTPENLDQYEAVVFLNTSGDVLNATQQTAFESYIASGGGFVGVHAAADTEYGWTWYGELVGAYFDSHPAFQEATLIVEDGYHPATSHLPSRWTRSEEWYNFQTNPRGDVHVLLSVDESSYDGGTMGHDHPIAWAHDFDGGRSFYTGLGHSAGAYAEPRFQHHLLGGIQFAAGAVVADVGATIDANYEVEVLDVQVTDAMEVAVADDGRVIYVERQGKIKVYSPGTQQTVEAGTLDVYTGQEDGLLGLALDPDFSNNHWIYLYYSPAGDTPKQHVSRFVLNGNQLDLASEKVLLEVPVQRDFCCHAGGSLAFGPDGSLYLSTGDDTNPFQSDGFAPLDERRFFSYQDAQRSAGNADDLRGKVLRIKPEPDGTYSIPEGNLFPADGTAGRPEIYVMGARNPFRISVDPTNGWLYFGDVGPDASEADPLRGPEGADEINQVREAGNFGWPLFLSDNQSYREYDPGTGESGDTFDPAAPLNDSPNNTGPQILPPAQPAFIWYTQESQEFPELNANGGRTAMAGPVVRYDSTRPADEQFSRSLDNSVLIYEWSRNWIKQVKLDENGEILKINPFLPSLDLARPMDMEMGPDGSLYILEWGTTFRGGNDDAQLIRITYTGGVETVDPSIPGDFNDDGAIGVPDISLLCSGISDGTDLSFDLTGDDVVDQEDLDFMINEILQSTYGDANLDRVFNSTDLILVFAAGLYEDSTEDNADWSSGDWNCDADFDTTDLVAAFAAGQYVLGAQPAASLIADRPSQVIGDEGIAAAVLAWEHERTKSSHDREKQRKARTDGALMETKWDATTTARRVELLSATDRLFGAWF